MKRIFAVALLLLSFASAAFVYFVLFPPPGLLDCASPPDWTAPRLTMNSGRLPGTRLRNSSRPKLEALSHNL